MKPSPRFLCFTFLSLILSSGISFAQRRNGGGGGGGGGGRAETEAGLKPLNADTFRVIYPYTLAMAGKDASLEATFVVDVRGVPTSIKVEKIAPSGGQSNQPPLPAFDKEAAAAFTAAIERLRYQPDVNPKTGAPIKSQPQTFSVRSLRQAVPAEDLQFIEKVKDPATVFVSDADVDGGLRGRQRPPVYPAALERSKAAGEAVLDFYIDETGVVRLVRVVSATKPEFGWSAAAAVMTWQFEPPTKGGVPVKVKVPDVKIGFTPPVEQPAAKK